MKRNIIIISIMLIGFTLLSACMGEDTALEYTPPEDIGDTGGLELPITEEDVTITMMIETDFPDRDKSLAFTELSRRTGVNIKTMEIPASNLKEKARVLVSSGDIPDIMASVAFNFREINDLGMQGAFAPINEYLDILPNFTRIFVDDPENNWVFKSSVAADGNLYYWPKYEVQRPVNHGFLYRKDIFDKHNIPLWSNPDEFYQALKMLKEIYPNSIPLVSKTGGKIFRDYAIGWGLIGDVAYYDHEESIWKPIFTDPKYREMLDLLQKLYAEELLDREFISDTQASWTAKMTQEDRAFVTFDWIGRLDMFREQVADVIPEYDLRFTRAPGPKGWAANRPSVEPGGYGIVIADNQNTEISLKLMDYITSDSGTELLTMGIEGVTYEMDTEGKITYPGFPPEKAIGIMDLAEKYGLFIEGTYTRMDARSVYFDFSEREQEAQDIVIENDLLSPLAPILSFNPEELDIITEYEIKLKNEAEQFSTRYVVNSSFGDDEWDEWIQKADSFGLNEVVKVYNDAQKRYDNQ